MLKHLDRNNDLMKICSIQPRRRSTASPRRFGATKPTSSPELLHRCKKIPEWISDLNEQNAAFSAMQSMAADLNTKVDGQYLFAELARTPVILPAATLEAFQQIYDGRAVIYPPTADAQLGSRGVLTHLDTGDLTMSDSNADTLAIR